MLHPLTAAKLATGLAQLEQEQEAGEAPPPGQVTRADLARRTGVSEATIYKIECVFKARLASAILQDPDAPPHLAKLALSALKHFSPKN